MLRFLQAGPEKWLSAGAPSRFGGPQNRRHHTVWALRIPSHAIWPQKRGDVLPAVDGPRAVRSAFRFRLYRRHFGGQPRSSHTYAASPSSFLQTSRSRPCPERQEVRVCQAGSRVPGPLHLFFRLHSPCGQSRRHLQVPASQHHPRAAAVPRSNQFLQEVHPSRRPPSVSAHQRLKGLSKRLFPAVLVYRDAGRLFGGQERPLHGNFPGASCDRRRASSGV